MSMFTDICAGMSAGDAMGKEIARVREENAELQRQLANMTRLAEYRDKRNAALRTIIEDLRKELGK